MTFQTGNALLGAVVVHAEPVAVLGRLHGTDPVAGPAFDAVRFAFGKDCSEPVENREAGSQGAKHFTEEAPVSHDEYYYGKEDHKPNCKRDDVRTPPDDCPGNCRFDGGHRTKPAEIDGGIGAEEHGDRHHEPEEDAVLDESSPRRDGKLHIRDLIEQLLEQTERACPSTEHPSREDSGQYDDADHAERYESGLGELPDHPHGTGKDRQRARMAIEDGKADGVPLDKAYVEQYGQSDLNLQS